MNKLALVFVALLVIITASCESDDDIVVTIDGTECKVSGPSEIETGEQIIVVRNLSDEAGSMNISRVAPKTGITYQDHLDYYGELPSDSPSHPPWLLIVQPYWLVSSDGDEEVWNYTFLSEGLYVIDWASSKYMWICAPLEVKEATAE